MSTGLFWFCLELEPLLLLSRYIIWLRKKPLNAVYRSTETKQETHLSTSFKVTITMSCECLVRLPIVFSEKLQNYCLVFKEVCLFHSPPTFFLHKSDRAFLVLVPVNLIYFQCPQALPSYCNPECFSFLLCQNFEPVSREFVFKQLWFSLGIHIWVCVSNRYGMSLQLATLLVPTAVLCRPWVPNELWCLRSCIYMKTMQRREAAFSVECPPYLMGRRITGEFCSRIPGGFFRCVSMSCMKLTFESEVCF